MFRGNLNRTGYYHSDNGCLKGELAWKHIVAGGQVTSPATSSNGLVLFGSFGPAEKKRRFWALDARAGKTKWSLPLDNEVNVAASSAEGVVIIPDGSTIRVVNADDGNRRWEITLDGFIKSVVAYKGVVYVGEKGVVGSDYFYHAFDLTSGRSLWHKELERPAITYPALDRETLYFITLDEYSRLLSRAFSTPYCILNAMDCLTGEIKWRICNMQDMPSGPPVLHESLILVPGESCIYAYDAETGENLWQWNLGRETICGPIAANGGVLYYATRKGLHARKIATGKTRWKFQVVDVTEERDEDEETHYFFPITAVSIVGDTAMIGMSDGIFYGVDIQTGTKKWECEMNELEDADIGTGFLERRSAVFEMQTIFFGAGNTLYALK